MIGPDDPSIAPGYHEILGKIRALGVEQWTEGKISGPSLDGLIYLCKFAFFTGVLTKSQIGAYLGADRSELRALVKAWYDSHRERGCGTC